jgi:beta-fructofuranosidase
MNLKPIYHFMPEKNWMNDPNGPIYYKGEYHLFYQHNPHDYNWGTMHWGHAKSKDLVHWEHLPIALYPSNELEELHCYSGCCVISDEGIPTIFYTSIGDAEGRKNQITGAEQWVATSKDDMISWEKHTDNPVMKLDMHKGFDITEWRDPYIMKDNGEWYMVVGGANSGKGCVTMYKSKDLYDWEFISVLYESEEYRIIECPNLIKFGDKYMLMFSPDTVVSYLIGTISDNFKFQTEKEGKIDYSGWDGFYAPNTLIGPEKDIVMWAWLTEKSRGDFKGIEGWAGVQSIPRILSLEKNNNLVQKPAKELQVLRKNEVKFKDINIDGYFNTNVKGTSIEILAEISVESLEKEIIFSVLASEDRDEETLVKLNLSKNQFSIDRSKSSLFEGLEKTKLLGKIDYKVGENIKLNIFIDKSTIEVFVNEKECLSTRIYPSKENSNNVFIFSGENSFDIIDMSIWQMNAI